MSTPIVEMIHTPDKEGISMSDQSVLLDSVVTDALQLALEVTKSTQVFLLLNQGETVQVIGRRGADFKEIGSTKTNLNDWLKALTEAPSLLNADHEALTFLSDFGIPIATSACYGLKCTSEGKGIHGYLLLCDQQQIGLAANSVSALGLISKIIGKQLRGFSQLATIVDPMEMPQANHLLLNLLFMNAIDAIVAINQQEEILEWNPMAETIFGWKREEVLGASIERVLFTSPEMMELVRQKLGEFLPGLPSNNTFLELSIKDKELRDVEVAIGFSNPHLNCKMITALYIRDNTMSKAVAKKLDHQKEFYESILNSLPTDIVVFDPRHKYLFVNPGAIANETYRKFIIGKDDFEYASYRNRSNEIAEIRREKFIQATESRQEMRWEDSITNEAGQTFTHLRRMYPVYGSEGELKMVIGFGIDITERKVMEEKQSQMLKQLSAQNTQLVDFCNIVSHNLRAPLVNISLLVKFIEEAVDPAEQMELISKLHPVTENLHNTFNELVESIQIKQDIEVISEKIQFEEFLTKTMNSLQVELIQSEALIEYDFSAATEVTFPPKYLASIFDNLLSNALKYKSPNRNLKINIKTEVREGEIVLSVADNGLGLDLSKHKENLFKIGKVFHRHPNAKGFGLFMTKTQVEAMSGKIWVESIPDEGSIFYVAFPNSGIVQR